MANQKLIDLSKKVKINLAKKTKLQIRAQVALLDDVSTSAQGMHTSGLTQRLFDRLFAVGYEFDDNKVIDAFAFDHGSYELEPIVEAMFGTYVKDYIVNNRDIRWGSTNYAPGMQMVLSHYFSPTQQAVAAVQDAVQGATTAAKGFFGKLFGKKDAPAPTPASVAPPAPAFKPAGFKPTAAKVETPPAPTGPDPVFCMLVTDGDNSDKRETRELLEANKDKNIFWILVGITQHGAASYPFLSELAKSYPNVDFYNAGEIDKVSDEMLYDKLFTPKFISWYENVRKGN